MSIQKEILMKWKLIFRIITECPVQVFGAGDRCRGGRELYFEPPVVDNTPDFRAFCLFERLSEILGVICLQKAWTDDLGESLLNTIPIIINLNLVSQEPVVVAAIYSKSNRRN
ncbi:hypothetical protein J6590_023795 [Homalodisca vitripennis]|nr:hypothetical protein J6590_023795 [Homalodisca vitripennis]